MNNYIDEQTNVDTATVTIKIGRYVHTYNLSNVSISETRDQYPIVGTGGKTHYINGKQHDLVVCGNIVQAFPKRLHEQ